MRFRFERCIRRRAILCSLERTFDSAEPKEAPVWIRSLTLLGSLSYCSFKYIKKNTCPSIFHLTMLSTLVNLGIPIPGSCDSVNDYCSRGWKQMKKEDEPHVIACSLFIWFISSPYWWKRKWSQETRRLADTQVAPREKSKYKCRTREQGSFLDRQCLCRSILLASCPCWDSLFLQWNSGSLSLFTFQV